MPTQPTMTTRHAIPRTIPHRQGLHGQRAPAPRVTPPARNCGGEPGRDPRTAQARRRRTAQARRQKTAQARRRRIAQARRQKTARAVRISLKRRPPARRANRPQRGPWRWSGMPMMALLGGRNPLPILILRVTPAVRQRSGPGVPETVAHVKNTFFPGWEPGSPVAISGFLRLIIASFGDRRPDRGRRRMSAPQGLPQPNPPFSW
jgi:hypothetical protein